MNFNSLYFILFFIIVIIIYYIIPHKFQWIILLISSYIFYLSWNFWLIFLLLGMTLSAYFSGLLIGRCKKRKTRKILLIISVGLFLLCLLIFKYTSFIFENINLLLNIFNINCTLISNIILPIGISFYTFQIISYVIDVYNNKIQPEKHLGYLALFISFFPQLIAGPVERFDHLLPQFKKGKKFNLENIKTGIPYIILGFFKKVVIADVLSNYVDFGYENYFDASGSVLLISTVFFAIQIYCDFSGYTDIAIGISHLLGIKLTINFNHPYYATSIRDFWRRWNISLTKWFTDYIYIPLGGNQKGKKRMYFNIFVVFFLSGLWHGANWTYILWGCLQGLLLILENLANKLFCKIPANIRNNKTSEIFKIFFTFSLVCFSWVLFRAETLSSAIDIYYKIFTDWGINSIVNTISFFNMSIFDILQISFSLLLLILISKLYEQKSNNNKINKISYKNIITSSLLIIIIIFVSMNIYNSMEGTSFIYFQF